MNAAGPAPGAPALAAPAVTAPAMAPPVLHRYGTPLETAGALAGWVEQAVANVLREKERAVLCVPGGSTPGAFLEALADRPLPWARITLMPSDDRLVPSDHARSNEGMIRARLDRVLSLAGCRFMPLVSDALPESAQAAAAAQRLRAAGLPDVVICGLGDDMHVASLFPGDAAWTGLVTTAGPAQDEATVLLTHPPALEPRLSLSPGALAARWRACGALARAPDLRPGEIRGLPERLERPLVLRGAGARAARRTGPAPGVLRSSATGMMR